MPASPGDSAGFGEEHPEGVSEVPETGDGEAVGSAAEAAALPAFAGADATALPDASAATSTDCRTGGPPASIVTVCAPTRTTAGWLGSAAAPSTVATHGCARHSKAILPVRCANFCSATSIVAVSALLRGAPRARSSSFSPSTGSSACTVASSAAWSAVGFGASASAAAYSRAAVP